jgi:hypothetical protein
MRRAIFALFLVLLLVATGCSLLLPGRPSWCGWASSGPAVFPPDTPNPIPTPNPARLLCISVENRSSSDVILTEAVDGQEIGWSRVAACSGMTESQELPATGSWRMEVGPAGVDGSPTTSSSSLATFDSSQLTGVGPYLLAVSIDADLTTVVEQRRSLPNDATSVTC